MPSAPLMLAAKVEEDASDGTGLDEGIKGLTISLLPTLPIPPSSDFTFTPPPECKTWPGPPYDQKSRFAPGIFHKPRPVARKSKQKSSKRKSSPEGKQATLRAKSRPRISPAKAESRTKKSIPAVRSYGSPATRDEPLHLLTLPGEIRNQIYRLLWVSSEPLVAQFRLVKLSKKGRNLRFRSSEVTRRFPREPSLVLGCRQLQNEVLSLFYSENTFIFRPSNKEPLEDLLMTQPDMMAKWQPRSVLANALGHLEVHFQVRGLQEGIQVVKYMFRKFADGSLGATSNTSDLNCCTCFEDDVLQSFRSISPCGFVRENLVVEAKTLVAMRMQKLQEDESMIADKTSFHPPRGKCTYCGLWHFLELDIGM